MQEKNQHNKAAKVVAAIIRKHNKFELDAGEWLLAAVVLIENVKKCMK